MHEASIVESLLEQVRQFTPAGAAVRSVNIEIGGLEHLEPDVMKSAYDALTADTPMAGSVLEVGRVATIVRCRACGAEHEPEDLACMLCPECGAAAPELIQGAGVLLKSIDVDQEASD
jgi:hydrogenase nickel incorporation protein HypA/HybF